MSKHNHPRETSSPFLSNEKHPRQNLTCLQAWFFDHTKQPEGFICCSQPSMKWILACILPSTPLSYCYWSSRSKRSEEEKEDEREKRKTVSHPVNGSVSGGMDQSSILWSCDSRWLYIRGDGNPCLCSKMLSSVRCPPWSFSWLMTFDLLPVDSTRNRQHQLSVNTRPKPQQHHEGLRRDCSKACAVVWFIISSLRRYAKDLKGEIHRFYKSESVYRCWRVLMHMRRKLYEVFCSSRGSCVKYLVMSPESASGRKTTGWNEKNLDVWRWKEVSLADLWSPLHISAGG